MCFGEDEKGKKKQEKQSGRLNHTVLLCVYQLCEDAMLFLQVMACHALDV